MVTAKKVKYTGLLTKPVVWKSTGLAGAMMRYNSTDAEKAEEQRLAQTYCDEAMAQIGERFDALFLHYEIDQLQNGAYSLLAWKLAQDHVPGCHVIYGEPPRGRGAPSIWHHDATKNLELLADVWALEAAGKSALSACGILAKSPKYKKRYESRKGKPYAPATLYRLYQEALRRPNPMLSKFVKYEIENGSPIKDWLIREYALDDTHRQEAIKRTAAIDAKIAKLS